MSAPSHVAVDRALAVLSLLGTRPAGVSLQELATSTGIPKPSLHRTLAAMRDRGFATQTVPGGPYLLGPAALEAAFRFHAGLDLRRMMHPLATAASEHFHQTCHVCVLDGPNVVYVDKVEANIGVRITSVIGGRNPAHATGVGKALLAELLPDDAAVRAWAQRHGPLQARTARTATSATMLSKSLNDVRTFGWAVDDEESEDGLLCVAARVPLVFGVLAPRVAVSVTGLRSRMVQYGIERTGRELVALIDRFEFHARDGVEPAQPQEGR